MTVEDELSDQIVVEAWRRTALEQAGVPRVTARRLAAADADLHVMLDALRAGCSTEQLRRIFL